MDDMLSPTIKKLTQQLQTGNEQFFQDFLEQTKTKGTPIVETCPIDHTYNLVTYIRLGDEQTKTVHVFGSFPGWDLTKNKLDKLVQTNLWFKTFRTNETFVSTYYFSINDEFENDWVKRSENYVLDRYNPSTFGISPYQASVFTLHAKTMYKEIYSEQQIPRGKVEAHSFYSHILENKRDLHIYTPYDYPHTAKPQDIIITFDGNSFMQNLEAANTLDHLIYKNEIPSCIVVGINHVDRFSELTYNDKMNAFLIEELLPWIAESYRVEQKPNHITLAGLSLGGLAAFYAAVQYPHTFGNVLSLSGSVHWKKKNHEETTHWIEQQFQTSSKLPLNIYMSAGTLENKPLLEANRSLYRALKEKEYETTYYEFQGGHDGIWWREQFAEGLLAIHRNETKEFFS